jgi:Flp pilus assembly pilin Flp
MRAPFSARNCRSDQLSSEYDGARKWNGWVILFLRKLLNHNMQVIFSQTAPVPANVHLPGPRSSPAAGKWRKKMVMELFRRLWCAEEAQDIAEYAVMLAVILVIVVGTIRLIGGNANNAFSAVASSLAQ